MTGFQILFLLVITASVASRETGATREEHATFLQVKSHLSPIRSATQPADVALTQKDVSGDSSMLLDSANLLMGTESDPAFSQGNVLPIVARPFGFNHWAPQNNRPAGAWWFRAGSEDSEFQLRCTHQPSPWIGDYGHFFIKAGADGSPYWFGDWQKALKPHLLHASLHGDGNTPSKIDFKMTPSMHGAMLAVAFPEGRSQGELQFVLDEGTWKMEANAASGFTSVNSGGVKERFTMYIAVQHPEGAQWSFSDKVATLQFPKPGAEQQWEVRVATSFISEKQARRNLQDELGGKDFRSLASEARAEWDELLSRAQVRFHNPNRSKVFYSNLQRSLLYPRFLQEKSEDGTWVHYSAATGEVKQGPAVADEGFWDAYRAHYPMLSFLYPDKLGELVNGWVNGYLEAGWLPTWASPGQRNCMVGTMGDCSLADAIVKSVQGFVTGFDVQTAFKAIRKDAFEAPDVDALLKDLGRPALEFYTKNGYVPSDHPDVQKTAGQQSAALTLNYKVADACVAQAAKALGKHQDAEILMQRSINHQNFDPVTSFFRPKRMDKNWDGDLDPIEWGHGFTEGNAIHYRFYAPHDIAGLVRLHGGREKLCSRIQEMFSASGDFHVGTYGQTIHEMSEAAATGFGQYAHNNQPVHDILYVAAASGCKSLAQRYLRQVMAKLYKSNSWSGDEDTGEMSSWYVLSSLGLFSLLPGSDDLVLGSPEVSKATIRVPGRPPLTIEAPGNSDSSFYVSSIQLDGEELGGPSVQYSKLARAGGTLTFTMSDKPVSAL